MPDYIVRPYDVLFFRGNKSFHFGQWYTEGVFPPYPSTFQGFIRSKILQDNGLIGPSGELKNDEKAKCLIGDDKDIRISIIGPYLIDTENNHIYFKTPSDLLRDAKGCDTCHSTFPSGDEPLESDLRFNLFCPDIPHGKLNNLYPPEYISLDNLITYRTNLKDIKIQSFKPLFTEDRVVIGIDEEKLKGKDRTVQTGRFCVTPYNRLKEGIGFYCNVDKDIKEGSLKFGSESHLVHIERLDSINLIEEKLKESRDTLIQGILKSKTFRMVLLQHGIFENGWLPFSFTEGDNKLIATVNGLRIELIFAFIKAPIKISGYSILRNRTHTQGSIILKPMVNAVPVGSVYMFRIIDGCNEDNIRQFVQAYDNKKIGYNSYSSMGYNHVILAIGA
ncbi:MAG: hypothetical protein Fur0020_10370 [Thermodesulfovibrionia bacterium]